MKRKYRSPSTLEIEHIPSRFAIVNRPRRREETALAEQNGHHGEPPRYRVPAKNLKGNAPGKSQKGFSVLLVSQSFHDGLIEDLLPKTFITQAVWWCFGDRCPLLCVCIRSPVIPENAHAFIGKLQQPDVETTGLSLEPFGGQPSKPPPEPVPRN